VFFKLLITVYLGFELINSKLSRITIFHPVVDCLPIIQDKRQDRCNPVFHLLISGRQDRYCEHGHYRFFGGGYDTDCLDLADGKQWQFGVDC